MTEQGKSMEGRKLNAQRIIDAAEVLGWLAEQAGAPGETADKRLQMSVTLTLAHLYLTEYAAHLSADLEPYDALMATVRGDLKLTESQSDLMRTLFPRPRPG